MTSRRNLGDAARQARRRADRERLERAARALLSSDGWRRWVRVRSANGLSRYSLNNQLLPRPSQELGAEPVDLAPASAHVEGPPSPYGCRLRYPSGTHSWFR